MGVWKFLIGRHLRKAGKIADTFYSPLPLATRAHAQPDKRIESHSLGVKPGAVGMACEPGNNTARITARQWYVKNLPPRVRRSGPVPPTHGSGGVRLRTRAIAGAGSLGFLRLGLGFGEFDGGGAGGERVGADLQGLEDGFAAE